MRQLRAGEVEARDNAQMLIDLHREAEKTGIDKLFFFALDEIPEREYPLINRFLRELGSSLHLGESDDGA